MDDTIDGKKQEESPRISEEVRFTPLEDLVVSIAPLVKIAKELIDGIQDDEDPRIYPGFGLYAKEAKGSVLSVDGSASAEAIRLLGIKYPIKAAANLSGSFDGIRETPFFRSLVEKMGGDESLGASLDVQVDGSAGSGSPN